MRSADHTRPDRQLHEVTTDPHLLAHATDGTEQAEQLLALAGADMAEVARITADRGRVPQLAVLADRLGDQHLVDKQKAPHRPERASGAHVCSQERENLGETASACAEDDGVPADPGHRERFTSPADCRGRRWDRV